MFLNLITSKGFWIGVVIVTVIFIREYAYHDGYKRATEEYNIKLLQLQSDNNELILNQEREYKDRENEIIKNYMQEKEVLKSEYEKSLIVANNLRDTFIPDCLPSTNTSNTEVSRKTKDKSGSRCYSESDLLNKIKESMAIGQECDELAIRYNALLEVCNEIK